MLQPGIGHHIDTAPLSRIDLAPAVETPPAGPVPLVLRALGHGTAVGHIDQGAIAAIVAVEEEDLGQVFQFVE